MIHLNTNKIIITTDFSETSYLAIKHGAFLAKCCKGEVFLLHVISKHWEQFSVFTPNITFDSIEKGSSAVQTKLDELAEEMRKEYGITVNTAVTTGNPTSEIVKYAKEIGAGFMVMGTHGYSAWEDLTIGSNALKVITKSPCPVMTMSERATKFGYKNIVLPIDNSSHSRQKVVLTLELAKNFDATVSIVGVLATNEEKEKGAMEVMLKQVEDASKDKGVSYTTKLIENVKNRAVAIVQYCEEVNGDLISIMTDQDAEVSGFFLGPFSLQVIHHSKVPVICIKPEEHPENGNWTMLSGTSGYNY
jgi:nucleotide-binding universal stress UspA family protein